MKDRMDLFRREIEPFLPNCCAAADVGGWLKARGFFDAPASTRYHGARPGGLFDHSLCVTRQLILLTERNGLKWQRKESPWVVGFFHDLCKVDQYMQIQREDGETAYAFNSNTLLRGHGDKSVMLLAELMPLTEEEVACIRYHMGAFTDRELWNDYTQAVKRFETVLWTHTADMLATHVFDT